MRHHLCVFSTLCAEPTVHLESLVRSCVLSRWRRPKRPRSPELGTWPPGGVYSAFKENQPEATATLWHTKDFPGWIFRWRGKKEKKKHFALVLKFSKRCQRVAAGGASTRAVWCWIFFFFFPFGIRVSHLSSFSPLDNSNTNNSHLKISHHSSLFAFSRAPSLLSPLFHPSISCPTKPCFRLIQLVFPLLSPYHLCVRLISSGRTLTLLLLLPLLHH